MNTTTEAIEILQNIHNLSYEEALNEYIGLANMYGTDKALSVVNDMKDEKYLNQHQYKIYYVEKDKRWHSYILVNGKRKSIAAKAEEDLKRKIIEHYKSLDSVSEFTINSVIDKFLAYKAKETSGSNAKKLQWAYNTYYKDAKISDRPLDEIDTNELKEFFLDTIETHSLTNRKYKDMKSLINMIYDYLLEKHLVNTNVSRNVTKISWKKFTPEKKKEAKERIFIGNEGIEMQNAALMKFYETGNTAYLAICLNFALALRIGEIVALKESDIIGDTLHVTRMETYKFEIRDDGTFFRNGYNVVPHAKSLDSDRVIPLTSSAKKILGMIIDSNREHGFTSEYLMLTKRGNRTHASNIDKVLTKLNRELGFIQRSNHGIRRTCLSNMNASSMLTDEEIRMFAGHSDVSTTQKHYIYATEETNTRQSAYEAAIGQKIAPVLKCTHDDLAKKIRKA